MCRVEKSARPCQITRTQSSEGKSSKASVPCDVFQPHHSQDSLAAVSTSSKPVVSLKPVEVKCLKASIPCDVMVASVSSEVGGSAVGNSTSSKFVCVCVCVFSCVCVYVCVCLSVCVCVTEIEREGFSFSFCLCYFLSFFPFTSLTQMIFIPVFYLGFVGVFFFICKCALLVNLSHCLYCDLHWRFFLVNAPVS